MLPEVAIRKQVQSESTKDRQKQHSKSNFSSGLRVEDIGRGSRVRQRQTCSGGDGGMWGWVARWFSQIHKPARTAKFFTSGYQLSGLGIGQRHKVGKGIRTKEAHSPDNIVCASTMTIKGNPTKWSQEDRRGGYSKELYHSTSITGRIVNYRSQKKNGQQDSIINHQSQQGKMEVTPPTRYRLALR